MHKIDGKNATYDNEFRDTDNTTTPITRGTTITPQWMNAVVEEIARCITFANSLNAATETTAEMKQLFDNVGQVYVDFYTGASGSSTITDRGSKGGSASRNAEGEYQITWDTPFADTNYNVVVSLGSDVSFSEVDQQVFVANINPGYCRVYVRDTATGAGVQFEYMHISLRATGVQDDA